MTYVKNASGTSRWTKPTTGESSWLEYWEKQTGKKATRCGATDCHSMGTLVGAHVQHLPSVLHSTLFLQSLSLRLSVGPLSHSPPSFTHIPHMGHFSNSE